MKKIILIFCLLGIFSLNVCAFGSDDIQLPKDFIQYSQNSSKVAEVLKISEDELSNLIYEKGIILLAVNEDNSKQIQLSCNETDFSNKVSNLAHLSDATVKNLLPDITGLENINGEIVEEYNCKFIKTEIKSSDGYFLTQYFTIENNKMYILSFYTDENSNTDYIEKIFNTNNIDHKSLRTVLIIGIIVFAIVCLILIYTIIKDIFFSKNIQQNPDYNEADDTPSTEILNDNVNE